MSVDVMSVDDMSVDEMAVDKMYVNEMTIDKMSVYKMTVDKMYVNEMTLDKMSVDEMIVDKMTRYFQIRECVVHLMFQLRIDFYKKNYISASGTNTICRHATQGAKASTSAIGSNNCCWHFYLRHSFHHTKFRTCINYSNSMKFKYPEHSLI
jgi:hypothetical protein